MPPDIIRLTPPGRGAIATVAVVGAGADGVVTRCLPHLPQPFPFNRPRRVSLPLVALARKTGDDESTSEDVVAEDVVVCRVESSSQTPRWEIHCHGGTCVVEAVVAALELAGGLRCESTSWRDPDLDPITDAAVRALAEATTYRAAKILLDQYHGALASALREERTAEIAAWNDLGRHLTRPWRVVLVGRPNVGKSRLFNALVGFDRAIVHREAGTTRDAVSEITALDGWSVELFDTAGVRDTTSAIELAGIERTRTLLASADLIIEVRDATAPQESRTEDFFQADAVQNSLRPPIVVLNKIDLVNLVDDVDLAVSAATGEGVAALASLIARRLVPTVPPPGTPVPFGAFVKVE